VKTVSLNFFCRWKNVKKTLLGLRQPIGYPLGQTGRQTTVQMQGLRYILYAQRPFPAIGEPFRLVPQVDNGTPDVQDPQ
jgi:hypothetical protein